MQLSVVVSVCFSFSPCHLLNTKLFSTTVIISEKYWYTCKSFNDKNTKLSHLFFLLYSKIMNLTHNWERKYWSRMKILRCEINKRIGLNREKCNLNLSCNLNQPSYFLMWIYCSEGYLSFCITHSVTFLEEWLNFILVLYSIFVIYFHFTINMFLHLRLLVTERRKRQDKKSEKNAVKVWQYLECSISATNKAW